MLANGGHDFDATRFDFLAGRAQIGGEKVDVQLQGIRAGLLDPLGISDAFADARHVEAANDRNRDRLFGRGQMLQVLIRSAIVLLELVKTHEIVDHGARSRIRSGRRPIQLFLEQRGHHRGRGTILFEPAQDVRLTCQRRRRRDNRVAKRQSQVLVLKSAVIVVARWGLDQQGIPEGG